MSARTNPFTREQLLDHARRVLSGHESIANICPHGMNIAVTSRYEADVMAAIVAVLESYPLANPAAECVRVVCEDLAQRGGFRELIEKLGPTEWAQIRAHLTATLRNTVVYAAPATKAEESVDMNFA